MGEAAPDHEALAARVVALLRDVPDFPAPGVLFKDFTPLLADADALRALVDDIAGRYEGRVDAVAGIEARGFVLGAAVAYRLGTGFVPVRKAGKLPPDTHSVSMPEGSGAVTVAPTDTTLPAGGDDDAVPGAPAREVHKWAQAGPRNQPKRPPKSKR